MASSSAGNMTPPSTAPMSATTSSSARWRSVSSPAETRSRDRPPLPTAISPQASNADAPDSEKASAAAAAVVTPPPPPHSSSGRNDRAETATTTTRRLVGRSQPPPRASAPRRARDATTREEEQNYSTDDNNKEENKMTAAKDVGTLFSSFENSLLLAELDSGDMFIQVDVALPPAASSLADDSSEAAVSSFVLQGSNIVRREKEMQQMVAAQNTQQDNGDSFKGGRNDDDKGDSKWRGSLLARKLKARRFQLDMIKRSSRGKASSRSKSKKDRASDDHDDEAEETGEEEETKCITIQLNPSSTKGTNATTSISSLQWTPDLSRCIRSYYNTGKIPVPTESTGNDVLLALEYFGVVYAPHQLHFESFSSFLLVKLWSEYYRCRAALKDWVLNQLVGGGTGSDGKGGASGLMHPCRHSHAFVTSPGTESEKGAVFYLSLKRCEVFDGGLKPSVGNDEQAAGSSRDVMPHSCELVHDLFSGRGDVGAYSEDSIDYKLRQDFCAYLRGFLPGIDVTFSMREVTVSSCQSKERSPIMPGCLGYVPRDTATRAVLLIDLSARSGTSQPKSRDTPLSTGSVLSEQHSGGADSFAYGKRDQSNAVGQLFSPDEVGFHVQNKPFSNTMKYNLPVVYIEEDSDVQTVESFLTCSVALASNSDESIRSGMTSVAVASNAGAAYEASSTSEMSKKHQKPAAGAEERPADKAPMPSSSGIIGAIASSLSDMVFNEVYAAEFTASIDTANANVADLPNCNDQTVNTTQVKSAFAKSTDSLNSTLLTKSFSSSEQSGPRNEMTAVDRSDGHGELLEDANAAWLRDVFSPRF